MRLANLALLTAIIISALAPLAPVPAAHAQTPTPTPSGGIVIWHDPCWTPQFTPPGYMDTKGGNTITGQLCPYGAPVGMVFVLSKGTDAPDGPGKVWQWREPSTSTSWQNLTGAFVGPGNYVGCVVADGQSTSHCTNALSGQTNTAIVHAQRITSSVTAGGWTGIIEFRPGNNFTGTLTMAIAWVYTSTPPVPTATPTQPPIIPVSYGGICISNAEYADQYGAGSSPSQEGKQPTPTPTPFGWPTATRTATPSGDDGGNPIKLPPLFTPTPGGPTLTPQPTRTPIGGGGNDGPGGGQASDPGDERITARFNTGGVQPFYIQSSISGTTTTDTTRHLAEVGNAEVAPGIGMVYLDGNQASAGPLGITSMSGALVLPRSLPRPARFIFWARPTVSSTQQANVKVWMYVQPLEQWQVAGTVQVQSENWRRYQVYISRTAMLSDVTGFAISAYHPDTSAGILLDDVQVFAGRSANSGDATGLRYCSESTQGGAANTEGRTNRLCMIQVISEDVFATCVQPVDIFAVGDWLGWLYCRVARYFAFLEENARQMGEMQSRQSRNQPIGSTLEMARAYRYMGQRALDLQNQARANNVDNYMIFNFFEMANDMRNWQTPKFQAVPEDEVAMWQRCSLNPEVANIQDETLRGMCYTVNILRYNTPVIGIIQWALHLTPGLMLIRYAQKAWFSNRM